MSEYPRQQWQPEQSSQWAQQGDMRSRPYGEPQDWQQPVAARSGGIQVPRKVGFIHRMRPGTLVVLGLNVLMLIWLISGIASASSATHKQCAQQADMHNLCESASHAGTAIGAALIIVLWVFVDIIGGVIWLVTNGRAKRVRSQRYGLSY